MRLMMGKGSIGNLVALVLEDLLDGHELSSFNNFGLVNHTKGAVSYWFDGGVAHVLGNPRDAVRRRDHDGFIRVWSDKKKNAKIQNNKKGCVRTGNPREEAQKGREKRKKEKKRSTNRETVRELVLVHLGEDSVREFLNAAQEGKEN